MLAGSYLYVRTNMLTVFLLQEGQIYRQLKVDLLVLGCGGACRDKVVFAGFEFYVRTIMLTLLMVKLTVN